MKKVKTMMIGNKIQFVKTIPTDVHRIIEFENTNSQFVCQYTENKHLALLEDIDCLHLSIRRIEDDRLIGHIILFGIKSIHKVLEFRRLTIEEKGKGYGKEAIRLLKKLCFEELKFHRLWLDVYDDNSRAIKLYESAGFTKEGILRENIKNTNGYRSQRRYSILENEYISSLNIDG